LETTISLQCLLHQACTTRAHTEARNLRGQSISRFTEAATHGNRNISSCTVIAIILWLHIQLWHLWWY